MPFIRTPFLLVVFLFAGSCLLPAQSPEAPLEEGIFLPNIKTVRFHIDGLELTYPIIDLNSSNRLLLSFDDLDADVKNYTYTLVHCNADWTPSNLAPNEYLDGFSEGTIDEYDYSFNTTTPYTHYWLLLPNEDLRFTKSGNYLLEVYEDQGDRRMAFTRRFMVVEPRVRILPQMVRPARVDKQRTHQEIDFVVAHDGFDIRNPRTELQAVILQNGRWDNAIVGVPPKFSRGNEQVFDYQDRIVFPAGNEFRYLDLRSLRRPSENVFQIDRSDRGYEVMLLPDEKRFDKPYLDWDDLNGQYVVETLDQDDPELEADYAEVLFTLHSPSEYADREVYLFGALSDWQLRDECRMVYNPAVNGYVGRVWLKEGFYTYAYALSPLEGTAPDLAEVEGNWFETRNNYTILLYFKPFGSRYDRLIGVVTFDSRS